jgi:hypothetical protein
MKTIRKICGRNSSGVVLQLLRSIGPDHFCAETITARDFTGDLGLIHAGLGREPSELYQQVCQG